MFFYFKNHTEYAHTYTMEKNSDILTFKNRASYI
jgi:hypothetical protein